MSKKNLPEGKDVEKFGVRVNWLGGGSQAGGETCSVYFYHDDSDKIQRRALRMTQSVEKSLENRGYNIKDFKHNSGVYSFNVDYSELPAGQKEKAELKFSEALAEIVNTLGFTLREEKRVKREAAEQVLKKQFGDILRSEFSDSDKVDALTRTAFEVLKPQKTSGHGR